MGVISLPKWPTIGEIARQTGIPESRLNYAQRSRGIEPVAIVGRTRCFTQEAAEQIIAAAKRIAVDQQDRGATW